MQCYFTLWSLAADVGPLATNFLLTSRGRYVDRWNCVPEITVIDGCAWSIAILFLESSTLQSTQIIQDPVTSEIKPVFILLNEL